MSDAGTALRAPLDLPALGGSMLALARELYPFCRSITGDGVRATLSRLGREVPLTVTEVPSGTAVLDWTVPPEWNISEAWIKDPRGRTVVDFRDSNLHVVGYSVPVHRRLQLAELEPHLHSLPEHPGWIPYRTSYYRESWGFCLPHARREELTPGEYEVLIDATLAPGSLTYGEYLLPGATAEEVLISAHVCHPSLANDNLSALVVTAALARLLAAVPERRYSYRFLWAPGTIGAITWLARNEEATARVRHGLVAANLGDRGGFTYKRSQRADAEIDRAVARVLADAGEPHQIVDFVPYGYDERQYCSPGFDLPVGSLTRTPHGRYPEYHTSADDLTLLSADSLAGSLAVYREVVALLEQNRRWRNLNPKGEPQLGRRGLYGELGGAAEGRDRELALLWVLNQSDGSRSLLDIAERSGVPFARLANAARTLAAAELVEPAD